MTHTKSLSLISLFASTAIFAVLALSGCPSDESEKPKAPAAAEVVKAPEKAAEPVAAAPAATSTPAPAAAPEAVKAEAKAEAK